MNKTTDTMRFYDVMIIGAGAAGLMCALTAGQRGRRVLVLDHANKAGKKILMSGGGRCNFTHLHTAPEHYFSANPHFCKSALTRYSPYDFLALVEKHGIEYEEKEPGRLFCKHRAKDLLLMLLDECARASVKIRNRCEIFSVEKNETFRLQTSEGDYSCDSLVVATGGLSVPSLGASGFGYEIARRFGLNVLQTRPALVPLTLGGKALRRLEGLSGLSLPVNASCGDRKVRGDLLFTHRGLSGPVILQLSPYWRPGEEVLIDLMPDDDAVEFLRVMKKAHPKTDLKNVLAERLPKRLARRLCELWRVAGPLQAFSDKQLAGLAERLHGWRFRPSGNEGYPTAEVTLGGVDTDELSSKTMEAKSLPGLYFVGEVVDVTGQLGGFNFQWAWASGHAAGESV